MLLAFEFNRCEICSNKFQSFSSLKDNAKNGPQYITETSWYGGPLLAMTVFVLLQRGTHKGQRSGKFESIIRLWYPVTFSF